MVLIPHENHLTPIIRASFDSSFRQQVLRIWDSGLTASPVYEITVADIYAANAAAGAGNHGKMGKTDLGVAKRYPEQELAPGNSTSQIRCKTQS